MHMPCAFEKRDLRSRLEKVKSGHSESGSSQVNPALLGKLEDSLELDCQQIMQELERRCSK